MKTCTKCGSTRFNDWDRCMDCRNARGKVRAGRMKENGGSHTTKQWLALLEASPTCAECNRPWDAIPKRPDPRYQTVWTKGHKIPVIKGGTADIANLQAECYQCNFRKNAGSLTVI